MKTLLREIYHPGQYFDLELFSNCVWIVCYPKLARGQAKFQFPGPYVFKLPLDNPRILYRNFKLVEFRNLYKPLEDNYNK